MSSAILASHSKPDASQLKPPEWHFDALFLLPMRPELHSNLTSGLTPGALTSQNDGPGPATTPRQG